MDLHTLQPQIESSISRGVFVCCFGVECVWQCTSLTLSSSSLVDVLSFGALDEIGSFIVSIVSAPALLVLTHYLDWLMMRNSTFWRGVLIWSHQGFFFGLFFCYYFMMKTWIAWISSTSLISVLSCIPLFQRGIPFKPSPLWFISFWLGEMMIWVSDLNSHLFPIEGTHLFTKL